MKRFLPGVIFFFLAGAAMAQPKTISPYAKQQVMDAVVSTLTESAFVPGVDFTRLPDLLKDQKDKIDAAKDEDAFRDAINEALAKLGISHTVILSPRQVDSRKNHDSVGIGISVQYQPKEKSLLIVRVLDDTPAQKAGLSPGDTITEINGAAVADPNVLFGQENEKVKLTLKRYSGTTNQVELTRVKYSTLRKATLEMYDKDTAVIKIPTFDLTYDKKAVEALFQQAHDVPNLILDLRGNPGGAVINLLHLMSIMTPEDSVLGTFVSRKMVRQYQRDTGVANVDVFKVAAWSPLKITTMRMADTEYKGHVAVLVNRGSGSAAEMAAAALRENVDAPVVGTKSAGMVLVSILTKLPMGYEMEYPVTDYVTKNGVRLEATGVTPDIVASDPRFYRKGVKDDVVEKAAAALRSAHTITVGGGKR